MKSNVKRYDLPDLFLEEYEYGDYVLYSDYEKLEAKLQKAIEALKWVEAEFKYDEKEACVREIVSKTLKEIEE
jgi:hypothetical protein